MTKVIALMALIGMLPKGTNFYPLTTTVVEVNTKENIVVCEDYNGNLWSFEETEDWMEGDIASMIMSDRGTEIIFDDVIVSVRYGGTR